jgi:hypothetical protein
MGKDYYVASDGIYQVARLPYPCCESTMPSFIALISNNSNSKNV